MLYACNLNVSELANRQHAKPCLKLVVRTLSEQTADLPQVALPADQLSGLILSSPASTVTVQNGFNTPMFGLSSPFSSGQVYVLGITTDTLSIANSG